MKKIPILASILASVLVLVSCDLELGSEGTVPDLPSKEDIVREVVREAVKSSGALSIPGVPTDGIVDCVIDNATDEEIGKLADATLLQSTAAAVIIVAPILKRPETLSCIADI